jgi:protein-S-isoprenylcysteine O-methyltransferase Ste14
MAAKVLRVQRNAIRLWLTLAGLLFLDFSPAWFAAGTALVGAGAAFRVWCKGHLTQKKGLTTTGPYALCRNPFYFGNLVLDLGICCLSGRLAIVLPYLALFAFVYGRQIRKEERRLLAAHGHEFLAYADRVPRFWPRPAPLLLRTTWTDGFSWRNVNFTKRIEIPRLLQALSYPPLFFLGHRARAEWPVAAAEVTALDATVACALVFLLACARILRLPLRRRKPVVPEALASNRGRLVFLAAFSALVLGLAVAGAGPGPLLGRGGIAAGLAALAAAGLLQRRLSARAAVALELAACLALAVLCGVPGAFFAALGFYMLLTFERWALKKRRRSLA